VFPISTIKVLVVDDSAFMRRLIKDIITSDPDMIVETAMNGKDALDKIPGFNPDVITLDVEMPVMDGLETLKEIMKHSKTPVIMISSVTQEGAEQTLHALRLGAVDFVSKPSGSISLALNEKQEEILAKIRVAASAKTQISHAFAPSKERPAVAGAARNWHPLPGKLNKLVIIGISTGGPKALYDALPDFPASLDAGVLIVQHMPPGFTNSLATRLNTFTAVPVKEAEDGEEIKAGCIYIAPGAYHLQVDYSKSGLSPTLCVKLNDGPPRGPGNLKPSVDVMFESVAQKWRGKLVAVIMTGMGSDGAESLKAVKEAGATIIAQDQATCVVYGMPRAAVSSGYVDVVAPLPQIVGEILKALN
jgi:two-component system chemotaxis response regulator CheB